MIVITTMEELPICCYECPCNNGELGRCEVDKEKRSTYEYRPYWCPLKERTGEDGVTMEIKLDALGIMPTRAHEDDAGLDLYAPYPGTVKVGGSCVFDTHVHVAIPKGFCGVLVSKSGLNMRDSLTSTGLIDSGYTGSIRVKLYNHGTEDRKFERGEKITQLVILPCITPELELVGDLEQTERGENGFGSSGK